MAMKREQVEPAGLHAGAQWANTPRWAPPPVMLALLCLFLSPFVVSAAPGGRNVVEPRAGAEIYNYYCYQCHGYNGDGKTVASSYLDPKPRDFTRTIPTALDQQAMIRAVKYGRPGTAMASFLRVLDDAQIESVVTYVRQRFMLSKPAPVRYHSDANGWVNHSRFRAAFPFATGETALTTPWETLSEEQRAGKRLYMSACISCHDNPRVEGRTPAWEMQAISYPRGPFP